MFAPCPAQLVSDVLGDLRSHMSVNVVTEAPTWGWPAIATAIAAFAALLLSQLPPIRFLIRGRRVQIVMAEGVMITHYLGNVNVVAFLSIVNTGGIGVAIADLRCRLVGPDGARRELPAQTSISRELPIQQGQASPEFPLGWVTLKPGEQWSQTVRFYETWSDSDARESSDIVQAIRENITAKLSPEWTPGPLVEADVQLVERARDFFEAHLDLMPGLYRLEVKAELPNGAVIAEQYYEFTLHESSVGALRAGPDEYKYGAGIYFPSSDPRSVAWVRAVPAERHDQSL